MLFTFTASNNDRFIPSFRQKSACLSVVAGHRSAGARLEDVTSHRQGAISFCVSFRFRCSKMPRIVPWPEFVADVIRLLAKISHTAFEPQIYEAPIS
jgi:hypothetical protein